MVDRRQGPGEYTAVNPTAAPRPVTGRQEPVRTATPTIPAETSAALAALQAALPGALEAQRQELRGELSRWKDQLLGAQQTTREETLEHRLKRWKGLAMSVGVAAAVVAIAVGAAVTTLRTYWGTAERAAEAKAEPVERRVEQTEARIEAIEDDISGIERLLGQMGRTLERIDQRTADEGEDEPVRRPRR